MHSRFAAFLFSCVAVVSVEGVAHAQSSDEALGRAENAIRDAEASISQVVTIKGAELPPSAVERLAAGELFLRNRDFDRAILSFNQVIELHRADKASTASHADALYLLGESYFRDDQLLSARRHFRRLAELGVRGNYAAYAGRALGRLVDVALRTNRRDDLDFVFAQIRRAGGGDANGSLAYAAGKAHFARRSYGDAERSLLRLKSNSPHAHQGGYLLGVVYLNQILESGDEASSTEQLAKVPEESRKFARAIVQFQKVTRLNPDSPDHQHVIDLAWMALGRLFYETDNYLDAIDAYSHVARTSPEFSNSLYELSWVYVRAGIYRQAKRALEVLSVVSPESLTFADGALLRADLMLRSEEFTDALEVYQGVRARFDPVAEELDNYLASTSDPASYYDRLVEERPDVQTTGQLSPMVMAWVREESEDERVFSLVDNVTRSRNLVRDSRRMVSKMNAVLTSRARVKAFPDAKRRLERAMGLINQLTQARGQLAVGLENSDNSSVSAALSQARDSRRQLMSSVRELPVTAGDFSRRETEGAEAWNHASRNLSELTLEADKLQSVVNGLRRILHDAERFGVVSDPSSRARFQAEVEANERDLEVYRARIEEYRESLEHGRVQIGFGDASHDQDARARRGFDAAFEREMMLAAQGQAGPEAANYARRAVPLLRRANAARDQLHVLSEGFMNEVNERAEEMRRDISEESNRVEGFADDLDALDQRARLLVGEVAKRNFGLVRERLRSIILRADVGIAQQAWEVRESHRDQVRRLQRQRASEEQQLNDELEEVLHDGTGVQ